jgi:hypothetical protein
MGLFSQDSATDIETISYFVETSAQYYEKYRLKQPAQDSNPVRLTVTGGFEEISEVGGQIIEEHFSSPTVLDRIAVLVVLTNALPTFALSKGPGKFLDVEGRKEFLSKFTCIIVQAALSTVSSSGGSGPAYSLRWKEFPDQEFSDRFFTFLAWCPTAEIIPVSTKESPRQSVANIGNIWRRSLSLVPCCSSSASSVCSFPLLTVIPH